MPQLGAGRAQQDIAPNSMRSNRRRRSTPTTSCTSWSWRAGKNLDRAEQALEGLPPELRGQADSVGVVRSGAEGAGGVARFGEASFIHTGTAGVQLRNKGSKRRLRRPRLRDGHRPGMNKGRLQEQLRPWKLIFVMTGQEIYPEFAAINAKSYLSKLPFSIHPDIVTAIHRTSSKKVVVVWLVFLSLVFNF